MHLNDSIRHALLELLNKRLIVTSWGISNICVRKSCISFDVDGFKYKGMVVISEKGKGYEVTMGDDSLCCQLDSLIILLDEFIERTADYDLRIKVVLHSLPPVVSPDIPGDPSLSKI